MVKAKLKISLTKGKRDLDIVLNEIIKETVNKVKSEIENVYKVS